MPSIDLVGVSYAYADSVPLLSDVSFHLDSGWTGVVGPNGAGKTTLLRLLAGELEPDAGTLRCSPPQVCLCAQRVERLEARVRDFAGSLEGAAQRQRGLLALDPGDLARWASLSPGERKRWQVGAALAAEPTILILDEPTNHLDTTARELLLGALRVFRGLGLVVSHDRTLLDRLCRHTLRFHQGRVSLYAGGYEEARVVWEAEACEQQRLHGKVRREKQRLERRLAELRSKRARAEARQRTSKRMKGRRDSSARGIFKATRRRSAQNALGREIGVVSRHIERVDQAARGFRFQKELGRSLFVGFESAPRPRLFELETAQLEAGGRVLLHDLRLEVRRASRIHLRGPNGSGKTTLLEQLVADARVTEDRLLYLPQELGEVQGRAILEAARAVEPETRGRLLGIVAALGVDPDALLASGLPSPGEARKLALAFGLARQVWALVLDEPTNHLDLPSIERLEQALRAYPGALLLVSHDAVFAERLTATCWEIRDGRIEIDGAP